MKMRYAIMPEIAGVTTQLPTIPPTLPHATASILTPVAVKPIIAPIIECVVDTGHPSQDAKANHIPAANRDEIIPSTRYSGIAEKYSGSIIPLRMVEVTSPPAKYAPANSKIMAITIACFIVNALEPTDVPIALATSFAPIPQAIMKPTPAARRIRMRP